jgi:hypothetical protein
MKFGGIIVLLLGLLIIGFVVKTQLAGTATGNPNDPTQAKRQLDNVRNRANELQQEQQKAADDIAKKSGGN